jgi:hypothetical protein
MTQMRADQGTMFDRTSRAKAICVNLRHLRTNYSWVKAGGGSRGPRLPQADKPRTISIQMTIFFILFAFQQSGPAAGLAGDIVGSRAAEAFARGD